MSLVSGSEIFKEARKNGYAIGAYNTNNLEWTQAILQSAQEKNAPVLIQTSMGAAKYMGGYKLVVDMVNNLIDSMNITVPVVLHLDHGEYEHALECIEAGYTSVMFDGSSLPFEENLAKTKDVVKRAHAKGMSVECEVGTIGGEEDGIVGTGELADIDECIQMVNTGIDFLACGIGNIHGVYPENWKGLDFDHLQAITEAVGKDVPLVLHGGSGIPQDQIEKAITMGISKVNVNTEFQIAFAKATRQYIEDGKDQQGKGFDPRKLLAPGKEAIIKEAKNHIDWFGSADKA
ncbi:class II fructose-bisphosphate aldolase [Tetragenococcus halophilus]|uniref:Fructose-bisphosphate aldolase n=1 Tax=Tetragenococcus halophilus subsp. halophilus TaxID=1513897 RepID=A0A2H6CWP5_TETHA|nr:class II fructose-bisphosphate aldolase [Tetragenococcus halophilus]RQD32425.1 fructose-1,6-bisphosphate aldolase, class II [Tetragenococcus halophilus subsp. halophilus DSM 20339]GBD59418.1 fructose-bisphosphate aldolase [Tetragenococcus halophilus subsp. halophilus]GBD69395.1 fructose-bisphosphate aldolase [Tetragenococcus halophilus subsp. halophilus]GFK21546.1 fructose-bisphosphate aldolase [Tetragenococcus halophilus]GMA42984.1 fructose-1,6-bisphosphate aldolase, class II [Tetragenococ